MAGSKQEGEEQENKNKERKLEEKFPLNPIYTNPIKNLPIIRKRLGRFWVTRYATTLNPKAGLGLQRQSARRQPVVQTQIFVVQGLLCGNSSGKAPYYKEKGPGVQGKRWPKYRYCFSCLKVRGGSLPSKFWVFGSWCSGDAEVSVIVLDEEAPNSSACIRSANAQGHYHSIQKQRRVTVRFINWGSRGETQQNTNLSRFLGRGCDEALFSEKKGFSVKRGEAIQWMGGLVRISTGKAIQWRGSGDSVNRRTLKSEKLLSSSPSRKSPLNKGVSKRMGLKMASANFRWIPTWEPNWLLT